MSAYSELAKSMKAEPSRWLITGVAGFIGSNLLEHLLKLGQTVVGLENGTLSDLGVNRVGQVMAVLGLDSAKPDIQARRKKRGRLTPSTVTAISHGRPLMFRLPAR